jgi:hypothetical protein
MLKLLTRLTVVGVAAFLAVLSALYLSAAEESFPGGAEWVASIDFSSASLSKSDAIAGMNAIADRTGLTIEKVVLDPENSYNSRTLYVFGSGAPSRAEEMAWFTPGQTGERRSIADLGLGSLNGRYVLAGAPAAVQEFAAWLTESGATTFLAEKEPLAVVGAALFNTGAWVAVLTCVILLGSLSTTWYVLRARGRALKVLNGAVGRAVVGEDLMSLIRASAVPVLAVFGGAIIVVAALTGVDHLVEYAMTLGAVLALAGAAGAACALAVAALTWPTVAGIASRKPPERSFHLLSEALKALTLILVVSLLPVAGASISTAVALANRADQWALLSDQAVLRIAGGSEDQFAEEAQRMTQFVTDAEQDDASAFAYAFPSESDPTLRADGIDGFVLTSPSFLAEVFPAVGDAPTAENPLGAAGTVVPFTSLPASMTDALRGSFELWTRSGDANELVRNARFFRYDDAAPFPGITGKNAEMDDSTSPLVAVIDRPTEVFDADFIGSVITSGNIMFDAAWVQEHLPSSAVSDLVLSVDRASDEGVAAAASSRQTAAMQTFSLALVLLALLMSVAVSAWIYALTRARRIFVERTAGWTWIRVLRARLVGECALALTAAAAMFVTLTVVGASQLWWMLLAIPFFVILTTLLHRQAVRAMFRARVARSA